MADVMTDSKRFVVLEAQHQADQLVDFVEYLALSQPQLGLKAIDRRQSSIVMYLLIRDLVDEQLAHVSNNPDNMELIASILFGTPKNKLTKEQTTKLEVVTNSQLWHSLRINLLKQINAHIEMGSWTDWTVVKSGSLIGMTEGEDHRITEYHKEAKALSVDDEAVVTLNCANPINYLTNEFMKVYGHRIGDLQRTLMDPEVKIDVFHRRILNEFVRNPTEYIVGLFLDTLVLIHPQIEISRNAFTRNLFIERALGIYDISTFQNRVVAKLIAAFGMNWTTTEVKKDQNYYVEYYLGTHVMAIFQKEFSTITEKYEAELLNAFVRGDHLPAHEREVAERLYLEQANRVVGFTGV